MNKKITWSIIILVAIIAALVWTGKIASKKAQEVQNQVQDSTQTAAPVTFYDQATGEQTTATFTADSVTFTNAKLGTMTLPQTMSADGARYADADESIVFWNKGNDLFITQNGAIVFNGSTGVPPENGSDSSSAPQSKLPAGSAPAADPSVVQGKTWVWTKTVMNDDTVVTPKKADAFTVAFGTDGRISGKTDCNGFSGTYKIGSDGVITIGSLTSTKMFCEGSQEDVFTQAVGQSARYMIDSNGNLVLLLPYDSGSVIFKKK